jgi:predicted dehydrogenase
MTMHRRSFLESSAAAGAAAALSAVVAPRAFAANDKISICMMGVRGRGGSVLSTFASLPEVEVRYVCDIDERALEAGLKRVEERTGKRPVGIKDFRKSLEDQSLDALVMGTPDHWHALPTIYACQAGKDVYVEKPDGHNILEGRTMVAAARKYKRVVQLGTQSRSGKHFLSVMDYLKSGALGKVRFAKAWESARQGSIGNPPDGQPPPGVDYDMWLGAAPLRPFNPVRFHGNWRWFFDYGTGDLGNDGVHRLDYARWALATALAAKGEKLPDLPRAVSAHGGKYYFNDAQEWPDTMMVTYDFAPGCLMTYEMRVWNAYPLLDESEGAAIHGDGGYVVIGNSRWRAYDEKGKLVKEESGGYNNDVAHAKNFLDCMRSRGRPNADLETIGHPSSLLCHIGNAAWRAGRTLRFDPATYTFVGDADANQYLTRAEYRKPWLLPKISEL